MEETLDLRCTLLARVGGKLVRGAHWEYKDGITTEIKVDLDSYTFYEFMDVIKEIGYTVQKDNISVYYTLPPDINNGLVALRNHDDMVNVFVAHLLNGIKYFCIDIYVDCPNVVDSEDEEFRGVDQGCITELRGDQEVGEGEGEGEGQGGGHQYGEVGEGEGEGGGDQDGEVGVGVEGVDANKTGEMDDDDDSSNMGVDESFDEEQEESIPLVGLGKSLLRSLGEQENDGSSDSDDDNIAPEVDENGRPIFLEFKESYMNKPQLIEGMKFLNVVAFRKLLWEYHTKEGYEFKFLKNESRRVTVKCAHDCGFRLLASSMYEERSFQIKKIDQQHSCTRTYTNNNATSSWLSQRYLAKFSDAFETKVSSMKKTIRREWLLNVLENKVYRAKRKALKLIRGDHRGQYARLWDYCEMVRIQNPSSTAKIKVDTESLLEGEPVFERIFISYDGQLRGFLLGCRPIIGLDACFLKGPFGGHLMHAVARDANNQMFPLAFAVVEFETKASWTWFMGLLVNMIGDPEERGWCFVSDRQKGLTQTFAKLYPNVEHRNNISHMYSNFSKVYKGKEWKDLMWKVASVYTIQEFEYHMNAIKEIDEGAYEYLMSEDPKTWARCMYGLRSKCNRMDNNTSEAFNQAIKDARDEPILTMLESIRRYLMTRLQIRRQMCMGCEDTLCPRIRKKVEKTCKLMREC
ncbi:uncharacterized protein LOC131323870 [Rhododendron vialii]|uniref:uncharacterized protein LOC131323870 n=1 Tax=Rhododendron vialii TaxID=182163 RepID=UPI00265FFB27|nr:uncharacterized protein LOC131323870 [Rhododendron vialii]